MGESIERRFDRYCEVITEALAHADRRQPARWYLKGLVLPEGRGVEPMAARVCPRDVRSAHQSMHHLVAESDWSDGALLRAGAGQVLPALVKGDAPCMWIVDDTGFPKKGGHSVGWHGSIAGDWARRTTATWRRACRWRAKRVVCPWAIWLYLPEG